MPFIFIDRGRPSTLPYKAPKIRHDDALSEVESSSASHEIDQTQSSPVASYQNLAQQKQRNVFYAGDIMQSPVVSLDIEQADLNNIWTSLQQNNIKHLVILKDKILHGICTERDVLKAIAFPQQQQVETKQTTETIHPHIQTRVYAATAQTDIHQLAHVMFDQHIGCMPIVDDARQVLGIVTRSDLLKLASHYGPMEFWA